MEVLDVKPLRFGKVVAGLTDCLWALQHSSNKYYENFRFFNSTQTGHVAGIGNMTRSAGAPGYDRQNTDALNFFGVALPHLWTKHANTT